MFTTGWASVLTFSTVNRLRPRHLAPRQWILARITARNAQHSPLTAAAKSHLVGFKNSFPLSIQHGARPATIAEVARQSGASGRALPPPRPSRWMPKARRPGGLLKDTRLLATS